MSMGPCGPLRVPEWLWGALGEQGQDPTARPAQKNTESLSDFTCVPHELVRMSGYTCPCPHVCVHLMCPSSVCISCPCVFGSRQLCVCTHLCAHPWACTHFSPCAPRPTSVSLCIQCACPPMALYTHACVSACYVDRAPTQELATFFWKGQEVK